MGNKQTKTMKKIYDLFDKNLKKLEAIKASFSTNLIDEVYVETEEEGNHYFSGQVRLFGHTFWIEGNSYVYLIGNDNEIESESEIEIESVWSGVDCEVEYNSELLGEAIKTKLYA